MNSLRGALAALILILFWQLLVYALQLPPYILPAPLEVFAALFKEGHLIAAQFIYTFIETLAGLALGIILGCSLALSMVIFRPLKLWLLPVLLISQALPTFAIAPLIVLWFGYGMVSKIITVMLMLFFPVASAFFDGLRQTNPQWLDLARIMSAPHWRTVWYIRIPAALPALASGIRVATAAAPIGAIIGEWVGASHGIGFLMLNANARLQIDLMFAALFVIVVFGLVLYFCVDWCLRKLIYW